MSTAQSYWPVTVAEVRIHSARDCTLGMNGAGTGVVVVKKEGKLEMKWHKYEFTGHCNSDTVKQISYHGPKSEYVIQGCDSGNVFVYDSRQIRKLFVCSRPTLAVR